MHYFLRYTDNANWIDYHVFTHRPLATTQLEWEQLPGISLHMYDLPDLQQARAHGQDQDSLASQTVQRYTTCTLAMMAQEKCMWVQGALGSRTLIQSPKSWPSGYFPVLSIPMHTSDLHCWAWNFHRCRQCTKLQTLLGWTTMEPESGKASVFTSCSLRQQIELWESYHSI